ncbi:MAG: MFS transporter, partial [Methanoregula sp.]
KYYGVASGINSTMRLLGQMLSMGVAMMIFAIVIGQVEITPANYPQFTESLHWAFVLFTVMCLAGIFFSLARGRRSGERVVEG